MTEHFVCKVDELKDGGRQLVMLERDEVGVFRHEGKYYAYSNYCIHQGGPACEGLLISKVEEKIAADKTARGLYFSDNELHFVCPWHGYEYDIRTGEFAGDRKQKLKKYNVVQKGDALYVSE